MASLLLLELHGRLLRELASSTGIHFQGQQQEARWLHKSGRSTTTISWRLRNIDVAANIVRHITQLSCDAYFSEIMSHVTQTDPVPAPDDEHVAPVSPAPVTSDQTCDSSTCCSSCRTSSCDRARVTRTCD